jgi:hypothetical protein
MLPDHGLLLRGMRHNCNTSHEGREDALKHFRNRMGTFVVSAALVAGGVAPVVLAQTAGQDIKHAGTDTKDAAKATGHGVAKGTTKAYDKTKEGTEKGYDKTKAGTKKAYHKTTAGTKHVVHKSATATEHGADKVEDKTDQHPQ